MKKTKFKSAEAKRAAEQNAKEWQDILDRHSTKSTPKKVFKQWSYSLSTPTGRPSHHDIPSRGDGSGIAAAKETTQYTGDKIIGISIIHKSCLQPVFNQQAAIDAATMRR